MTLTVKLDKYDEVVRWLRQKAESVPAAARRAVVSAEALVNLHQIGWAGLTAAGHHDDTGRLWASVAGVRINDSTSAVVTLGPSDTSYAAKEGGTMIADPTEKWGGSTFGMSYGFFWLPANIGHWFDKSGGNKYHQKPRDFLTEWYNRVKAEAPGWVAKAVAEELKR